MLSSWRRWRSSAAPRTDVRNAVWLLPMPRRRHPAPELLTILQIVELYYINPNLAYQLADWEIHTT
eukprot:6195908-Pleurochrysis_carterae.AAC.5